MRVILGPVFAALVAGMVLASCGGTSPRAVENATSARVLQAVNQERVKRGLGRLAADAELSRMAMGHANFLVRNVHPAKRKPTREVAHANFKERAKLATAEGYPIFSEVVMIGYAGDLNAVAERTMRGWLNSPGHRRAILNKDRKVMGVETRLPADGRYFVVGHLSDGRGR